MAVSGLITAMQSIFATPEYADRIPNSVKSVITEGNYGTTTFPTAIENAVYNVLVDKIGKQEIYKFEYNNFDASQYDKGYLPFGGIIEDDYVEAMKADEVNNLPTFDNQSDYEFVNYDPFKINYASIAPSYYTLKTLLQYHVTTAYDVFKRAFISEGYATNFIQTIRSVLPESAKLDKYLIFRNMLASSTIYPSGTDVSCVVAGSTMTAAESIQIVKTIRNYVEAFKWNTTKYNKQGKLVSSKRDDLVLFMAAGIITKLFRHSIMHIIRTLISVAKCSLLTVSELTLQQQDSLLLLLINAVLKFIVGLKIVLIISGTLMVLDIGILS